MISDVAMCSHQGILVIIWRPQLWWIHMNPLKKCQQNTTFPRKKIYTPEEINIEHVLMEVWFRSFSFLLNGVMAVEKPAVKSSRVNSPEAWALEGQSATWFLGGIKNDLTTTLPGYRCGIWPLGVLCWDFDFGETGRRCFFGWRFCISNFWLSWGEGCLRLERWRGKSSIRLIFLLGMLKYNIHSLRTNIAPVRRSSRQLVCQYRCLTCYFWDLGRYLLVYKGTRGTKTWDALSRNTFARFSKINPKKHRSNTDIFVKQNWP